MQGTHPKAVRVETWPGPLLPLLAPPDVSSVAEVEERVEEWDTPYQTEQPDRHCTKLSTLPDLAPYQTMNQTKPHNKLNTVPK